MKMAENNQAQPQAAEADKHDPAPAKAEQNPPKTDQAKGGDTTETLGAPGLKALQDEREARKGLEQQIAQMRSDQQAQMAKLAEAFGLTPDKATTGPDVLAQVQQQVTGLLHDNLVLKVAAANQITDADDLALLHATQDETAMTRLASRLARAATADPNPTPGRPRPDLSQAATGPVTRTPAEEFADLLTQSRR